MQVDDEKLNKQNLSRAIDRSANERTFLAWMRAAIALMGLGVIIVRLRVVQVPVQYRLGMGWKLGLLFSIVGLLTVLLSTKHYFGVRQDIDYDTYEPTDRWVILFSLAIAILGAGVIYYMFTVPSSLEGLMAPE